MDASITFGQHISEAARAEFQEALLEQYQKPTPNDTPQKHIKISRLTERLRGVAKSFPSSYTDKGYRYCEPQTREGYEWLPKPPSCRGGNCEPDAPDAPPR